MYTRNKDIQSWLLMFIESFITNEHLCGSDQGKENYSLRGLEKPEHLRGRKGYLLLSF